MFRLWGKEYKDNRLVRDIVICDDTDDTRTHNGICNVRRHNCWVLPGEAGYELKPFGGNKRRVGDLPALILSPAMYAESFLFFNDVDFQIVKINKIHEAGRKLNRFPITPPISPIDAASTKNICLMFFRLHPSTLIQIVKINKIHEAVLIEAYFGVLPEFFNGRFQPDRLA